MSYKDYPSTDQFKCIDTITVPHPYCITPRHVAVASDSYGGMLGDSAIAGAEKEGARCGVKGCNLSYSEHETAILVEVKDKEDRKLKDIPGLKEYVESLLPLLKADNYAGFTFIKGE